MAHMKEYPGKYLCNPVHLMMCLNQFKYFQQEEKSGKQNFGIMFNKVHDSTMFDNFHESSWEGNSYSAGGTLCHKHIKDQRFGKVFPMCVEEVSKEHCSHFGSVVSQLRTMNTHRIVRVVVVLAEL